MLIMLIAPLIFFLVGYLFGYVTSRVLRSTVLIVWAVLVVVWAPIATLLVMEYAGVVEPGTLSGISAALPRVVKLPVIGFLVGYTLTTVLAALRGQTGLG